MKQFNDFIDNLNKLISIKSVLDKKTDDAPFGENVKLALNTFLSIAKNMGFSTINYDNYGGEVFVGEGEEIGIIGHLDVVPEGDGWNTPPFSLTEKDGTYFGRGVLDDKAPLLICLYALNSLKTSGIKLNKKFRLFCGCDEESGWNDVKHIKTKTTLPTFGFSPDGDFPVSYAEKGMAEVTFSIPKLKNFSSIKGGTVVNAVCGLANVKPNINIDFSLLNKYNLKLENGTIISVGKSAHGSIPSKGQNALKPLFNLFLDLGEDVGNVIDCIFNDKYNLTKMHNEQGYITISPDLISETEKEILITCDLRVPSPFKMEDAFNVIKKFDIPFTVKTRHLPHALKKDGGFIKTLITAFNSVCNEKTLPISQGGSTFARVFDCGSAFGPEFPNQKSTIHEANECVKKEDLLKMYSIYEKALFLLNDAKID